MEEVGTLRPLTATSPAVIPLLTGNLLIYDAVPTILILCSLSQPHCSFNSEMEDLA